MHNKFEYECSADGIYVQEVRKIWHIVLVCRLVRNDVYIAQSMTENCPISYASSDKIDICRQVRRSAMRVNLRLQTIQHSNMKSFL